jgi:hypothetical protein
MPQPIGESMRTFGWPYSSSHRWQKAWSAIAVFANSKPVTTACWNSTSHGHTASTKQKLFLTTTEAYYICQSHALVGGTVVFGPPHAWFQEVGPGAPTKGNAPAIGFLNYTEWKLSKKDFLSPRPLDILVDKKGERTGFPTTYESWTVGVTHRFDQLI